MKDGACVILGRQLRYLHRSRVKIYQWPREKKIDFIPFHFRRIE